jgi:hypothetical protein
MVRKNGRIVSPETVASSSTKTAKSIAVILVPLRRFAALPSLENAYATSRSHRITI